MGLKDYNNRKTKIAPPKLEGEKKGVFATRSPHRYNPIGLSIAKLDRVEERTIHISGIDLIHGTPVIDIKPYHYLDSLPQDQLQFPNWLLESKERGRFQEIVFAEQTRKELQELISQKKLDFYDNMEDIESLITQVFELNPHSVHTLNKHKEGIYAVALDNLNIVYSMDDTKKRVNILKIIYVDNAEPAEKLRTKEWLQKMSSLIDFKASPGEEEEVGEKEENEEKKERIEKEESKE